MRARLDAARFYAADALMRNITTEASEDIGHSTYDISHFLAFRTSWLAVKPIWLRDSDCRKLPASLFHIVAGLSEACEYGMTQHDARVIIYHLHTSLHGSRDFSHKVNSFDCFAAFDGIVAARGLMPIPITTSRAKQSRALHVAHVDALMIPHTSFARK